MSVKITLHPMQATDWTAVAQIYAEGLATGNATFETAVPAWEAWDEAHLATCRLVAKNSEDAVMAWAALTAVSGRCVYAGVAEVSVYVAAAARGQGVGKQLLQALVAASEAEGIWTLQAGVFAENVASVRLHESCGFRIVGSREKLGQLDGRWRDVLLLERRSKIVGV